MSSSRQEAMLWRGRPSFWNWWFELLLAGGLLALAGGLVSRGHGAAAGLCAACACAAALAAAFKRLSRAYCVTSERLRVREGLFGRKVGELDFIHVRGVEIEQSFWQRLSRTGDVRASSTAAAGAGVAFSGIGDPAAVAEIIRRARKEQDAVHAVREEECADKPMQP